jgi:hypothetical protein
VLVHFGSLSFLLAACRFLEIDEASEGLAPFRNARRLDATGADLAAASPISQKGIPALYGSPGDPRVMSPGTGTEERREKDRPIDPMSGKKFARKRARSGVEPLDKRTGASPSLPKECLTTPVFELVPSVLPCEADAAAFCRARRERLSSSDGQDSELQTFL